MSVARMACDAVTAVPLRLNVPSVGRLVISTDFSALAGVSLGSLNAKSVVLKT